MGRPFMSAVLMALLMGPVSAVSWAMEGALPEVRKDVSAAVRGNTAFALELYARLRAGEGNLGGVRKVEEFLRPAGEGNLFFSPMSISTALRMTYAGARGGTAAEMATVLHLAADPKEAHASLGALLKQLNRLGSSKGCQLDIANALWAQKGYGFLENFLKVVSDDYGAGFDEVDYVGNSEPARKTINDWVARRTREKIKDLIPPGVLDEWTRLVLTNAIYFKDDWAEKFDEKFTADAPFMMTGENKITVRMMNRTAEFSYLSKEGFQVLEMPYAGDALSMVIFLPGTPDGLGEFEKSLTSANLDEWLKALRERRVTVYLPRFTTTVQCELSRVLASMGMPLAFSPDAADFSGMNGKKDLYISKVIHKAFVDVNEKGTEAAAATGIVMRTTAVRMPEPPVVFRADHPFVFVIRDKKSGSILFMGRVVNPKT